MAKNNSPIHKAVTFITWFTGVVVSLAVSFGLVNGTLVLPRWLGGATAVGIAVTQATGWIILITTLVGVLLAIFDR